MHHSDNAKPPPPAAQRTVANLSAVRLCVRLCVWRAYMCVASTTLQSREHVRRTAPHDAAVWCGHVQNVRQPSTVGVYAPMRCARVVETQSPYRLCLMCMCVRVQHLVALLPVVFVLRAHACALKRFTDFLWPGHNIGAEFVRVYVWTHCERKCPPKSL